MCSKEEKSKEIHRQIMVKIPKARDRQKIQRRIKKKQIPYKGSPIRLTADFSEEIMEAFWQLGNIFKVLKEKKSCPSRILYLAMLSFKDEGEVKTFQDKEKLREIVASRSAL